jgi:DNA-binding transcriptional ArsR family regulator
LDRIAVGLVDAAIQAPGVARDQLSRELLALSSVLSIARSGGLLSGMNTELIGREAHNLLQEVAVYEEPRLFLEEAPSLAALAKEAVGSQSASVARPVAPRAPLPNARPQGASDKGQDAIRHISDKATSRRDAILSVLNSKGPSYIKDISTVIRDVSEKTIQRELQALVAEGVITRSGERRWTTYQLAS